MLGYCPIPLYPNSIYMIVLNFVLHSARRKLSMKLEPHLPAPPFLMPSSPSSCLLSLCPPPSLPSPSLSLSFRFPPYFFFFSFHFPVSYTSPPPLLLFL